MEMDLHVQPVLKALQQNQQKQIYKYIWQLIQRNVYVSGCSPVSSLFEQKQLLEDRGQQKILLAFILNSSAVHFKNTVGQYIEDSTSHGINRGKMPTHGILKTFLQYKKSKISSNIQTCLQLKAIIRQRQITTQILQYIHKTPYFWLETNKINPLPFLPKLKQNMEFFCGKHGVASLSPI